MLLGPLEHTLCVSLRFESDVFHGSTYHKDRIQLTDWPRSSSNALDRHFHEMFDIIFVRAFQRLTVTA
jgi:hypothetical protein